MLVGSLYKRGEDVRRHGYQQAPWSIKWRGLDGRERRRRVSPDKAVARQHLSPGSGAHAGPGRKQGGPNGFGDVSGNRSGEVP